MIRAVRGIVALSLVTVLGLAMLPTACGSDSSAAAGTPFTVWIFDEGETAAEVGAPLAHVRVAVDRAGGEHIERTTEGDGHVTFDVDFTRGPVHVSAFSAEHTLVTRLAASPDSVRARPNGFAKPAEDLAIVLPRLDATIRDGSVAIHGAIAGKRDKANTVDLSTSALRRLGDAETTDATYSVRAPKNQPFVLLGHEAAPLREIAGGYAVDHVKSFRIDLPAKATDDLLDIDVSASPALPIRQAHLGVTMPATAGSPFVAGTRASAVVESADSKLLVGTFGSLTTTADMLGFDLVLNVAQTDIGAERVSTRASLIAPDGSRSTRTELGVVADGARWNDFLAPMPIADVNASIAEPISLAGFPPGSELRLEVYAADQLVWVLEGPPGGAVPDTITMPPPLGIDFPVSVQVVAVSIIAQADRVELPPHGAFYRREAASRDLILRRR